MNPTDPVTLIVLFRNQQYLPMVCSVDFADRLMQVWWKNREIARGASTDAVMKPTLDENLCPTGEFQAATQAAARHWLKTATYASNIEYTDGSSKTYCRECFAWSEVIGMYVKRAESGETPQEKAAKAMSKIADVMNKEADRGEEWKS